VLYAFFACFALTIAALPAFADVLILVDKSTQQISVSVDGLPRYQFEVSLLEENETCLHAFHFVLD